MATQSNKPTLEDYFDWYLNELKEAGYILTIKKEPFKIQVTPGMHHSQYVYKTGQKPQVEKFNMFRENTYKMDRLVEWAPHAKEIFFNLLDGNPIRIACPFYASMDAKGRIWSLIDVKPPSGAMMYNNNTTSYTFPIIQKMLYWQYGIYVNKAIPIPLMSKGEIKSGNRQALFVTTFTPKRYLMTDGGGGQARDIKFQKKSLREYVTYRTLEIDKINLHFNTQLTLL